MLQLVNSWHVSNPMRMLKCANDVLRIVTLDDLVWLKMPNHVDMQMCVAAAVLMFAQH